MLKKTSFIPNNVCISDLIRHFILAWLLAAAAEYFFLPGELRGLADLDGLAQMSFVRFVGMTGGIAVLLTGISFFVNLQRAERWCIVAVFGLLAGCLFKRVRYPGPFWRSAYLFWLFLSSTASADGTSGPNRRQSL